MIVFLDTSTSVCRLTLVQDDWRHETEWEAHRDLARGLLGYMEAELKKQGKEFSDITALATLRGPGSFTGLRIGLTVLNTLADALSVPIIGEDGDDWQEKATARIHSGENDRIVLPMYGSEAHITSPRK